MVVGGSTADSGGELLRGSAEAVEGRDAPGGKASVSWGRVWISESQDESSVE